MSIGTLGAARVLDHIRPVLATLGFITLNDAIHISKADEAVTTNTTFTNENTAGYVQKMIVGIGEFSTAFEALK